VAAFQQTVYPIVRNYCASCHSTGVQPFFASTSVQNSHDALINNQKVDLTTPANSALVLRLSVDRHFCWSDCLGNSVEMRNAIMSWKNLVNPTTTPSPTPAPAPAPAPTPAPTPVPSPAVRVNTNTVLVPANTPVSAGNVAANFSVLTFPLDSTTDTITPDIAGGTFTVEIQKFDDFSYRLRNPKVVSPNANVYARDVRFAINGAIRANDVTFALVDQVVPLGTAGAVLSPSSMVMLLDKGVGVDRLNVSFGQARSVAYTACKNVAGFTANVKPTMMTTCVRCHGAGNVFDMISGTDANICLRAKGRADLVTPANSDLILKPYNGINHSGGGGLYNQTTMTNWLNWINSER
jgi:hypothetical protein